MVYERLQGLDPSGFALDLNTRGFEPSIATDFNWGGIAQSGINVAGNLASKLIDLKTAKTMATTASERAALDAQIASLQEQLAQQKSSGRLPTGAIAVAAGGAAVLVVILLMARRRK